MKLSSPIIEARSKRVAYAFLAFFFGQGLGVLTALLLVPLYLLVWSPQLYGEWLALHSVAAYLSTLDFGVQTYAVNRLTQAYARGDLQGYRQIQHTAFAFYLLLALLGTFALLGFAHWAPIGSWLHISLADRSSVASIVVLLGVQFLWVMPASLVWTIYTTVGDLAKTQWVMNGANVLSLALTAATLVMWPRLAAVAGAQLLAFVLVVTLVWRDVRKRYPDLAPGFAAARLGMIRPIVSQGLFFALIDLAVGATLQGSNLIVAGIAGTAALAVFVTTRTLANSVRQLVSLFVHSFSTNLTQLEALEDKQRLRLAFRLVLFATVAGCLAVSASLWFEGSSVFYIWTRGKLHMDIWLLRMFLLWLVLQSPWMAASAIPSYTNKHRALAFSYLFSSVGGLLLGMALVPRFGLKGLPLAFILAEAVGCYHFVVRDACEIIGESYLKFAPKLWAGMAGVGAGAFVATWQVHQLSGLGTFSRSICSGSASLVAVVLATWLAWFREEERGFVRRKTGSGVRVLERVLPLRLRASNS